MYKPLITDASKKYGNNRWLAFSNKLKRVVYLFSDLEYEHWLQVETDPDIIDFCEQPIKMEMIENGKTYSSIVDMWVKYKSNEEAYIEIKYRKDLLKDTVKKQIYIQEVLCQVNQIKHLIKTEDEIKLNPIKLSNLKFIIKQVKNSVNVDCSTLNIVKSHIIEKPKTVQQVTNETKIEPHSLLNIICILLYEGEIKCNLDSFHIGKHLEVWK